MITANNLDNPFASGAFGSAPPTSGGRSDISSILSRFGGAVPGLADALSSFLNERSTGGALDRFQGDIQQGIGNINQAVGSGVGFLKPIMSRGNIAGDRELALLNQGQDPTRMINTITSGFEQSPEQKALISAGTKGLQNRLVAQGINLSGSSDEALAKFNQDQTANQLNQFIGNVLAGRGQTISGLSGLAGQGLGAAGTAGQEELRGGEDISSLLGSAGESELARSSAENRGTSGMIGGLSSALSNLLPGGGSGSDIAALLGLL